MRETNNEDLKLIERYHHYELDEKEMQGVLKRMDADKDFEQELHSYGAFEELLHKQAKNASKKKTVKEWDEQIHPRVASRSIGRYIRAIAAVFLLALATWAVYHFMGNSSINAQQYAMNEITVVTNNIESSSTRGGDNDLIYQEAFKAYQEKDYTKAIAGLKTIPTTADLHADAQLFLGKLYLLQKNWAGTIVAMEQLKVLNKNQDSALWLQTLAYIQMNELDKAKVNLTMIIEEDYPKAKDAKVLLNKL